MMAEIMRYINILHVCMHIIVCVVLTSPVIMLLEFPLWHVLPIIDMLTLLMTCI